ncbi:MAG: ribosome small subunit-dependent GTPase A [bacterium]|nr:ribosome small subunit-dependent GTPase A [bacterium]
MLEADISRKSTKPDDSTHEGIVIRATAGHLQIACDNLIWRCNLRGRLKKGPRSSQTIAVVGDQVRFSVLDEKSDPPCGVVEEVLPRRNRISRMAARRSGGNVEQVLMANLDQVVAVQSVMEPAPQTGFVDRLLVASERFGVGGILVLNKWDLVDDDHDRERWEYFEKMGYQVVFTSAENGLGVEDFREVLTDKVSLLIGASGVGKSTLLNAIEPNLGLRVNEVTGKTGLGKHTTTRTELFPLATGGFIADSPGIRGFDPWDIDPLDVQNYFPDFHEGQAECRFRTCLHRDEPSCGVKQMVQRRQIPHWRHDAYLALLRDLEDRKKSLGYR